MLREGSSLLKQPDIIIPDLDGPRSFTLIDVKIFDPAATSYADSSAKSAQHRHRALEAAGPREYFGASRRPPPGSRMRICTFVVSSHLAQFAFVLAAHSLSDRTLECHWDWYVYLNLVTCDPCHAIAYMD